MPRRDDIETIALIGSGPIVIGQACEFDYSGTQALRVLRDEGYRTVLINSNPATIMTDPGWADRTYLEPLDLDGVRSVLERERPDALLPTLGGQTALNLASQLEEAGILEELGIELIGASYKAIQCAEDREIFAETMASVGPQRARQRDRDVGGRSAGRAGLGSAAAAGRDPPGIHARGPRRRLCRHPAGARRRGHPRCPREPHLPGAARSARWRAGASSSWR